MVNSELDELKLIDKYNAIRVIVNTINSLDISIEEILSQLNAHEIEIQMPEKFNGSEQISPTPAPSYFVLP